MQRFILVPRVLERTTDRDRQNFIILGFQERIVEDKCGHVSQPVVGFVQSQIPD